MRTFIDIVIQCLPELTSLLVAIIGAVIGKKIVPLISAKNEKENLDITAKQISAVKEWIEILVASAQRLDKSGNLGDLTKKEYVAERITEYISKCGYGFTSEQLDDIRRSAVYLLEQSEYILSDVNDQLTADNVK